MRVNRFGLVLVLVGAGPLLAWGCGDDGNEGTSGAPTSGGEGGAGNPTGAGRGGAGDGASNGASAGGGGSAGVGGEGGSGQGGSGEGGAVPALCQPKPDDDACVTCLKGSCCDQGLTCFADANCAACVQCALTAEEPSTCVTEGICDPLSPEGLPLFQCWEDFCLDLCSP
jgi:hypothetical protein